MIVLLQISTINMLKFQYTHYTPNMVLRKADYVTPISAAMQQIMAITNEI